MRTVDGSRLTADGQMEQQELPAAPRRAAPADKPLVFPATHVLSYEDGGRMQEEFVRLEGEQVLTKDEWFAHAVPDWTLEEGRLFYCGIDFSEEKGKCGLRPVGAPRLKLDALLLLVTRGMRDVPMIARTIGRSWEEVSTGLATLERLGKVVRETDEHVSPVFGGLGEGREP